VDALEETAMRVPSYDNLQVGVASMPQPTFRPAVVDGGSARPARLPLENRPIQGVTIPDTSGQRIQQAGDQIQRVGQMMANMQIEAEKQVAQVRVDDALNRAKEAALRLTHDQQVGYKNIRGLDALERQDGKSLEDEYTENLVKEIRSIGEGLGTEAQRAMFSQRASDLATQFRSGLMQHASGEYRTYQLSVAEGVQATALNDIGLNYDNPKAVADAVDRIKANVYRQAQLNGKSAEWQEAKARSMTSGAHKVAMMAALEKNDVEYAQGYLAKFANDMEADDILQVRGLITKEMNARVGLTAASEVLQRAEPSSAPTDMDRAFNILIGTESGGRQFDRNGQPLTSSAGAIGIAQVMPNTGPEAAKLAGLKWDEQRYKTDPEYNRALGRAYFEKQLQDFDGRLDLAYAAYNAGPGRLKQAIAKSRKEGGEWLDHMPQETQRYVAKNMREYGDGKGRPKPPTFDDIDQALRNDPRLAGNPEAYKIARTDALRQFESQQKAKKQRDEEALSTALEMVEQNGGSYAMLPLAVRNAVPADKRDTVMSFAEKVAKGTPINTDPQTYYALSLMAADQPEAFGASDLRPYFDRLAPPDRKHFIDMQAKANKGEGSDIATATQQTNAMVQALGLKKEKAGVFHQQADIALMQAQREKGRSLTQEERQRVLDQLVLKGDIGGRWRDGYAFEARAQGRTFKPEFSDADRRKAAAALARAGNTSPSKQQIEDTIRRAYGISTGGATGTF
jgi:soluble lytic murein transglycosylase